MRKSTTSLAPTSLFERQSRHYRAGRPTYPPALFAWLADHLPHRRLAWDCATGTGQAARGLLPHLDAIVATDLSAGQIEAALPHPRITYRQAEATAAGLPDASVALITVATALHWLPDLPAFFAEAHRALSPGGLLAAWTYGSQHVTPEIDALIDHLSAEILDGLWAPQVALAGRGYGELTWPFEELPTPALQHETPYDVERFLSYLRSWSASQRFVDRFHEDPTDRIAAPLREAWGAGERMVRWPLSLRVGRKAA